jgi:hypothetical protein
MPLIMVARFRGIGIALLGVLLLLGVAHQFTHPDQEETCLICVALPGGRRDGVAAVSAEEFRVNRCDLRIAGILERKRQTIVSPTPIVRSSEISRDNSVAGSKPAPLLKRRFADSISLRGPPARTLA